MNQKTLNIIFGIVIVILVVAVAYFAFGKKAEQLSDQNENINVPLVDNNQNLPTAEQNQNVNEPAVAVNTNQPVVNPTPPTNPMADWKSYNSSSFSIKYPTYLSQKAKEDEVKSPVTSIVSFQGTAPQSNYGSLLSIEQMVNQGGLTLTDWTNEIISQSKWIKQGSVKISGQTAYILVLPETDAGARYFFLSKDGRTMFVMTIQHFDQTTIDSIISSFLLKK
ncbi:MAG: hypothetical protein WC668_02045 [Patescibacteria group bacterium]|jgi:cbb3-type cytochrome oxidase subunit 3